jgi:two-component sensor histidine kinase
MTNSREEATLSPTQNELVWKEIDKLREHHHRLANQLQIVVALEKRLDVLEASLRESRMRLMWGVGILVAIITAAVNVALRFV